VPKLNRDVVRAWLVEHNWSVGRLARECSAIGEDTVPEGVLRNAVNGIDPMRPGRINLIRKVTEKYGDGITYDQLLDPEDATASAGKPTGPWRRRPDVIRNPPLD